MNFLVRTVGPRAPRFFQEACGWSKMKFWFKTTKIVSKNHNLDRNSYKIMSKIQNLNRNSCRIPIFSFSRNSFKVISKRTARWVRNLESGYEKIPVASWLEFGKLAPQDIIICSRRWTVNHAGWHRCLLRRSRPRNAMAGSRRLDKKQYIILFIIDYFLSRLFEN